MRFHVRAVSPLLAPLFLAYAVRGDPSLTVETTSGTFTGLINCSAPDVNQWLGIPYAQPPLGSLRFMPPEASPNYGSVDAQAYKPICFQDNGNKTGVFWELVPEFENRDPQSEDCLYLNIWSPRKPQDIQKREKKVPVIIWVDGGGFKEGGGHALYLVPDQWIQRTQTHIVVTFNARLNIFGFPGSPAAYKNAGLMDVRLVVEWLRDNIQGFGGDPERMILYGQSAGANQVLMYAYANPHDPIVNGFIISSSGTTTTNPATSPNFHNVAQTAGCANLTVDAELTCMQGVDALVLQEKVHLANPSNIRGLFRPIVDNITAFANLTDRLQQGLIAPQADHGHDTRKPMIAGFTYNEPAAFEPFDINATAPSNVTVPGLSGLACGVKQETITRAQYGLTTYRYLYSGNFSNITPRYWLGGMHESDLPIVFGTHYEFRGNSTELEWETSFAMESMWVAFASAPSDDPTSHTTGDRLTWPKFNTTDGQIIVFGNATGPSVAYIAPVAIADKYSDPC